jgi:hypothetical protein
MKANPEKFQAIAIGKQTKQQNLTFTLDGNKNAFDRSITMAATYLF